MTLPQELADTHARAMPHHAWSVKEFTDLLAGPGVFLVGDAVCFILARVAADEAEVLTLATNPSHRRKGLARAALDAFHATALDRGATTAFLEVAADNEPALALYQGSGWIAAGRRRGYYVIGDQTDDRTGNHRVDAIILRRDLTQRQGGLRD